MQSNRHGVVRNDAPVVDTLVFSGRVVNIRCRGNLSDVIIGMKLLTRRSLPVNAAALQVRTPTVAAKREAVQA